MVARAFFDWLWKEITQLGGLLFYVFVVFAFFFGGLSEISVDLVIGFVFLYGVAFFVRMIYFKPRPRRITYRTFLEKINTSSFPSVHSARVTFLALYLLLVFDLSVFYQILAVALALSVMYSRIYLKKHYFVDVLGGFLLGILTYFFVLIL